MGATLEDFRQLLRNQLPLLRDHWGVASLELFGSRVREEAHADSDLDILVSFEHPVGLYQLVELENFLSEALAVKVDLVLRNALKPRIGERILAEAVPV